MTASDRHIADPSATRSPTAVTWLLGDWQYRPDNGELRQGRTIQRLPTQLNAVLNLLVKQAPKVVTREQFLDQVWTNKWVNEDALSRTIAELRKLLGDSASQAKYIKTIPKKGYQLALQPQPLRHRRQRQAVGALLMLGVLLLLGLVWSWSSHQSVAETLQQAVAGASRVTALPGMEQQSTLSADGQWLTYVRQRPNDSVVVIQSLTDANEQHLIELARHRLASPYYAPATGQVFMTARDQTRCFLKAYDMASATFTDLAPCAYSGESRSLAWQAAQRLLAFSAPNAAGLIGIQQWSFDRGGVIELTQPPSSDLADWSPAFSPDGRWLSFSRGNQSVRNLWLQNSATGEAEPLTSGEHYTISHSWYDDEHVVFDSDLSGSRQLWVLNIHDRQPQLLGAYGAQHPSFDAVRALMTYQTVSYEANIWMYDIPSGELQRLVHSTKYDNYPNFGPNGRRFLFSSNRSDQSAIWSYDLDTGTEQQVFALAETKLTRPHWHGPDNQIIMTRNDASGYSSLLLDLASSRTDTIDFGMGHMDTQFHQGAYFALAKSAAVHNRILHWQTGQVSVLPPLAVSRFMVTTDGQLLYSKSDADGLYLYDPVSQQESLLLADFSRQALNLWTTVNHSVYHDQGGEDAGLWHLDLRTGTRRKITDHRPYSVGTSLSVNRAETQILLTRTDRAESDILLVSLKP
ncbi:winged helix-turn-helix domain-containing protein [Marinicella meishanensis]|uniref:winged helix-turn-helix domain-containing protein n=1 Tax=Marinicella meishanensis TaxID=2873263 RepID=UPI001CC01493|nr:winged helix-turn-helix domain-containing protein [Marinicella sp. NBU2979]